MVENSRASTACGQVGGGDEDGVVDIGVAAVDGHEHLGIRGSRLDEGAGGAGLAAGAIEQDGFVKAHVGDSLEEVLGDEVFWAIGLQLGKSVFERAACHTDSAGRA